MSALDPVATEPHAPIGSGKSPIDILRGVHALHPFFGFTMRPGITPADTLGATGLQALCRDPRMGDTPTPPPAWATLPANALGMWSEAPFPYAAQPNDLVVGLFGSSVAAWFALQGRQALAERLAMIPELRGQRLVLLGFGIPGGKQPQQLSVLSYVLSRGQHLDLAINIDGYNELMWASYNHHVERVDFSYPTCHLLNPLKHLIHGGDASPEGIFALARSLRHRRRAQRVADLRARLPLAPMRSALGVVERALRRAASRGYGESASAAIDPAHDPLPLPSAQGYDGAPPLAAYWRDCSLQFHRICAAHRIVYLHLLQPNLYSTERPPTEEERAFMRPDDPILRTVREQYPQLLELGRELRAAGVLCTSPDAALAKLPYSVFADCWGHLNQLGNIVLAELIGTHLERLVQEEAATGPAAAR